MDNFREWLSDNLRYILLGLAVILLAVALFFGIRFLSSAIGDKDEKPDKNTEQENNKDDEAEPTPEAESGEQIEAPDEVKEFAAQYYTALGNKDVETLRTLTETLDASDVAQITRAQFIENYTNIEVAYARRGVQEDSYIIGVSYDFKLKNIETPAPGLAQLYIKTNEEGRLYLADADSEEEKALAQEVIQSQQVQELSAQINQELADAKTADPMLAQVLDQLGDETNYAEQAENGATIVARQQCNVRKEPNTECEILGQLEQGDQVVKQGMTDNWIQIEYNGQTAYVRSDMFQ